MEQIQETLKCKYCLETLSSKPVIITCCFQTICFDHIAAFKSHTAKETLFKNYGVNNPYENKEILARSNKKRSETWIKKKILNNKKISRETFIFSRILQINMNKEVKFNKKRLRH